MDQHGNPVDGAAIKYSAIDRFFESGSKYGSYSDENGYFSIENIKGAGLSVSVSKEGYYPIDGKSSAAFAYGVGADSTRKLPPSKDNPAFFELQKKGETEPLVRIETGGMSIPKNGTPVRISLAIGLKGSADQATIQVEAWTNNQGVAPNSNQLYDWRFRVSVPGGGLVDRIDQFGFEAPLGGYKAFDAVGYRKGDQPWKADFEKKYFASLSNGTYARFKLFFTTGGTHFIELESYVNPIPGHRNLEFDPKKSANPQQLSLDAIEELLGSLLSGLLPV